MGCLWRVSGVWNEITNSGYTYNNLSRNHYLIDKYSNLSHSIASYHCSDPTHETLKVSTQSLVSDKLIVQDHATSRGLGAFPNPTAIQFALQLEHPSGEYWSFFPSRGCRNSFTTSSHHHFRCSILVELTSHCKARLLNDTSNVDPPILKTIHHAVILFGVGLGNEQLIEQSYCWIQCKNSRSWLRKSLFGRNARSRRNQTSELCDKARSLLGILQYSYK